MIHSRGIVVPALRAPAPHRARGEGAPSGRRGTTPAPAHILVIAPNRDLTFVEEDIRILSRAYSVHVLTRQEHPSLRSMLPAVVRRFVGERCALVYLWFAEPYDSLHIVLLARLFGVRTVIVAGGYDIAWQPLIGYGALSNGASHRKVKKALQSADAVLPFSRFSAAEIGDLGRTRGVRVIYPGVDCGYFAPAGDRERLVVTAGTIAETVWLRKGLDVFARCARLCRELRFLIIGHCASPRLRAELQALGGDNLEFTDTRIGREQLLQCYRRSSVYAQLSTHEGFGLALAEAMSCECVPVATSIGSLPEVVGDTGFLVAPGDATAAAAAIAHARDADLGVRARQRIKNLFALETRERQLLDTVAQVLAVGSA